MPVRFYETRTFRSDTSIAYLLKRAYTLMHEQAKAAFEGTELGFLQWLVLLKLSENPSLTASDLCRILQHDPGAFTRLLDALDERGLIMRRRDERDRRAVNLSLSPLGKKTAQASIPLAVESLNNALRDFSKVEMQQFVVLLNKFIGNVSAQPASQAAAS